ncbi:MAG: hypothetical protein IK026_06405 [Eubacteriaceae bacterium]|nr:hypothetical protein [Eubacteriaceae bacterium]
MRKKIAVLIVLTLLAFGLTACAAEGMGINYSEIYSVDCEYYFYVPKRYEDSISNLGYYDTVIVRFTNNVHALINAEEYYSKLTAEQRGGYKENEFTIGSPAVDATFNNKDYIEVFFNNYFKSISSYTYRSQISQEEFNGQKYWTCRCYSFYSGYNPDNDDFGSKFKGETKAYYTIHNGKTYFINVTSTGGTFIDDCLEANRFMENFHVGIRLRKTVYYAWAVSVFAVLMDIIFLFSVFFRLEWEPLYPVNEPSLNMLSDGYTLLPFTNGITGYFSLQRVKQGISADALLERKGTESAGQAALDGLEYRSFTGYVDEAMGRTSKSLIRAPLTDRDLKSAFAENAKMPPRHIEIAQITDEPYEASVSSLTAVSIGMRFCDAVFSASKNTAAAGRSLGKAASRGIRTITSAVRRCLVSVKTRLKGAYYSRKISEEDVRKAEYLTWLSSLGEKNSFGNLIDRVMLRTFSSNVDDILERYI